MLSLQSALKSAQEKETLRIQNNYLKVNLNEAENTIIHQRETIELQNQSIQELNEKLRVAYNQISDQGHKSQLIDQQRAEIERLRAALYEAKQCLNPNTTDYEYIEQLERGNQQPEPPQESPETQVLKFLATCEFSKTYMEISEGIHGNAILKMNNMNDLVKAGYLKRNSRGWQITAAGRDYLASLDKPKLSPALQARKESILKGK